VPSSRRNAGAIIRYLRLLGPFPAPSPSSAASWRTGSAYDARVSRKTARSRRSTRPARSPAPSVSAASRCCSTHWRISAAPDPVMSPPAPPRGSRERAGLAGLMVWGGGGGGTVAGGGLRRSVTPAEVLTDYAALVHEGRASQSAQRNGDPHDPEDFTPFFSGKSLRDHENQLLVRLGRSGSGPERPACHTRALTPAVSRPEAAAAGRGASRLPCSRPRPITVWAR
jgi:hypothetical protein